MKRGIVITFFILLLLALVAASPTTTLNSPSNGASESSTITFTCSVSDTENISTFALYTDTGGTWSAKYTNTSSPSQRSVNYLTYEISSISDGSYNWNCFATNDLAGTAWASSNYTFTIASSTVTFTGSIANQTLTEDTPSTNAFDLDDYFTGATSYSSTGGSNINATIDGDNQVTLTPGTNWTGSEILQFSGTDGDSTNYSNYINVSITPVNDAPHQTANFTNQSWNKNINHTITVSAFFTDVDGDSLNYSASSTSSISINITDGIATLVPTRDWTGSETVAFTATDGTLSITGNTITLIVNDSTSTSSNNATSLDSYSPESDPTLALGEAQDFTVTYSDSDNDTVTATWYLDNSQTTTGDAYTFSTETDGVYTVRVDLSDGTDTTAKSWQVTVGSGTGYTGVSEDVETNSIITDGTETAVCGNGVAEEGENCLTCAVDVKCETGYNCEAGVCIEKKSPVKTIVIFLIILIVLIGGGIGAYYLFLLKKPPQQPQQKQQFQYKQGGVQPPMDYTDFYNKKK